MCYHGNEVPQSNKTEVTVSNDSTFEKRGKPQYAGFKPKRQ